LVWKEGSAWEVFWIQEQKVRQETCPKQLKGGTSQPRPSAERRARSWTEAPGIGKAMEFEKEKEEDTDSETDDWFSERGPGQEEPPAETAGSSPR